MFLKFKTLTLKISGLCVTKRVLNQKSIPIYYVDIVLRRKKFIRILVVLKSYMTLSKKCEN